jgi:hypothetical protein
LEKSPASPKKPHLGQRIEAKKRPHLGQRLAFCGTQVWQLSQKNRGALLIPAPPARLSGGFFRARAAFRFWAGGAGRRGGRLFRLFGFSVRAGAVGYIKPAPLKNDPAAAVNKPAHFFTAFGTYFYGLVRHALKKLKVAAAASTFIFIRWHVYTIAVFILLFNSAASLLKKV